MCRFSYILAVATVPCLALLTQRIAPPKAPSDAATFIFASANTAAVLTDAQAEAGLQSFEQRHAVALADRAACASGGEVNVSDALGIYDASSENSYIVEAHVDTERMRYLAALLGLEEHQQWVLSFRPASGLAAAAAPDRLWTVRANGTDAVLAAAVRRYRLAPATVAPSTGEIFIVSHGSEVDARIEALASDLHTQPHAVPGDAGRIGNDDRYRAASIFRGLVGEMERRHGWELLSRIDSPEWSGAVSRTCSHALP